MNASPKLEAHKPKKKTHTHKKILPKILLPKNFGGFISKIKSFPKKAKKNGGYSSRRLTDERIPRTLSSTSWCDHPIPTPSECPENGSGQKPGSQNSTCFFVAKTTLIYKFVFCSFQGRFIHWIHLEVLALFINLIFATSKMIWALKHCKGISPSLAIE